MGKEDGRMKMEVNEEVRSDDSDYVERDKESDEAVIKKQSDFLAERIFIFHLPF